MGVFGLTTYVNGEESFWTEIPVQNTKVIVDANGLLHHLYFSDGCKMDYQCGGQYKQLHDKIVAFFKCLEENNVEPYVLLDGAPDPNGNKRKTSEQRLADKIRRAWTSNPKAQTLPLLAGEAFIQAMRECSGVRFAVCDFEADPEIAALAAKWECLVISSDSDFFIFDLEAGYIPLKHLKWDSGQLKAKLFKAETFCAQLGIQNGLLPLFASLLGNDIVKYDDLKHLYSAMEIYNHCDANEKIRAIQEHFAQQNVESIQEGIESILLILPRRNSTERELRRVVESSVNSYKVGDSKIEQYFQTGESHSSLKPQNGVSLRPFVLKHFRQGSFPSLCIEALTTGRVLLRPQAENLSVESVHQCSLKLRQFLYGLLGKMTVEEVGRNKGKEGREKAIVREDKVQSADYNLKSSIKGPLRLDTIPNLDADERHEVVLSILESNTGQIRALSPEDQLFVASVRYWIQHAKPAVHQSHLHALLLCYLTLTEDERSQEAAKGLERRSFDLAAQHNFTQWQCVMHEALNVNYILEEPLPTPSIWRLYDGLLVQFLLRDFRSAHHENQAMETKLYEAATEGIEAKLCNPEETTRVRDQPTDSPLLL